MTMMNGKWMLTTVLAVTVLVLLPANDTHAAPANETGYDNSTTISSLKEVEDLYAPARIPRHSRKVVFRARTLRRRGDSQGALQVLQEQLANHPDQEHDMLYYWLGQCLMDVDEHQAARDAFARSVELEPRLDRAWIGLGDAAYQLKSYGEASEAFEKGFRLSPERPVNILFYSATTALLAGQNAKALSLHQELVSGRWGDVRLEWYRGLASSALENGTPELADKDLEDLLARFGDDPRAWQLVYQFNAGRADYRRAAIALTVTGYLRDLTLEESRILGDLYAVVGVPALSLDAYRAVLGDEPTAENYEKLVSACLASHRTDEALAILDEALAVTTSGRLWSLKGDVHYLKKEYGEASEAFARVLGMENVEPGRAHLMVGYCAIELGNKELALDHLGRAVEDPDHTEMAQLLIQRALKLRDG
jgi:tetratricopeptide (TPR) repeat protein